MLRLLLAIVLVGCVIQAAYADGEGYIELVGSPTQILYEGQPAWEYWYDVYSGGLGTATQIWLEGFDADKILNPLTQRWDSKSADGWFDDYYSAYLYPAFGDGDPTGTDQWVLSGNDGEMLNPIHSPSEYLVDPSISQASMYPGSVTAENELHYWYARSVGNVEGLYMTIRLVHPWAPGDITYSIYGPWYWDQENAPIIGPAPAPPGDFNRIDGVNDIDIDLLCDAIYAGSTNVDLFDISANGTTAGQDGFIDIKDLDYLIRFLVETGIGKGTEYGDFDLSGVIDTTDLARLALNFGDGDWGWNDGNGNRYIDTNIDTTDLAMLAMFFGFGETDVIPEPATLSLLALGGAAVIRRRHNK